MARISCRCDLSEPMSKTVQPLLVGVPCDTCSADGMQLHSVGDMVLRAIMHFPGVLPILVPAMQNLEAASHYLDQIHGLLLTGAESNVHPECYWQCASPCTQPYDTARDSLSMQLIGGALMRGMPLLALCRGCQELNVALGGTLQAEVHEPAGRLDHRAPESADLTVCFATSHAVDITADGLLHRIVGTQRALVNSLHRQSVLGLGQGVIVQAHAPDGIVEAISVANTPFALGVQWHPEAGVPVDAVSMRFFEAFLSAYSDYRASAAEP